MNQKNNLPEKSCEKSCEKVCEKVSPSMCENIFEYLNSLNTDDLKLETALCVTKSYIKYGDCEKVESAFINSHLHLC